MQRICIVTYDEYINIPYIQKYECILRNNQIEYDIILWDRRNETVEKNENHYVFKYKTQKSKLSKLIPFFKWRKFALKVLKSRNYDKIIVLTTIPAVLISTYLLSGKKYLLDIRDYTYEYIPFFKGIEDKLIFNSALTTISSKGFFEWIKAADNVKVTHNISNIDKETEPHFTWNKQKVIRIGFIGGIRYEYENKRIIDQLKNNLKVELHYIGKTHPGIRLREYCKVQNIENVYFGEAYMNKDKPLIYQSIDIINAVYGSATKVVTTALPNKLYDCILFKKPIIVSSGTYLANVVEKYHIGFSIDIEKDDIWKSLNEYINLFNEDEFLEGCEKLKRLVIKEEEDVNLAIKQFILE